MLRKCLLLSGHFVFIVSSEIRTRAGRERGKGNKKREDSQQREADQSANEEAVCHVDHYYHLRAVITRWMQHRGYFHKTLLCFTESTLILDCNWPISLSIYFSPLRQSVTSQYRAQKNKTLIIQLLSSLI